MVSHSQSSGQGFARFQRPQITSHLQPTSKQGFDVHEDAHAHDLKSTEFDQHLRDAFKDVRHGFEAAYAGSNDRTEISTTVNAASTGMAWGMLLPIEASVPPNMAVVCPIFTGSGAAYTLPAATHTASGLALPQQAEGG